MTSHDDTARWKLYHAIGWGLLAAVVTSHALAGFPMGRGLGFFVGIALVLGVVGFDVVRTRTFDPIQVASALGAMVLAGFVVRFTTYDDIALVTGDHQAFLSFVNDLIATGSILSWGTYTDSPFVVIELSSWKVVLGVAVLDVRLVSLTTVSLLPLLLATALYAPTGNTRAGLFATLLATPFVLFTRGAALAETEFLVLLWFALMLLLLLRSMRSAGVRSYALLLGVAGTSTLLHPFYAFVFAAVIAGTAVLRIVATRRPFDRTNAVLVAMGLVAGILVTVRALLTVQAVFAVSIVTGLDLLRGGNLLQQILSPSGGLAQSIQIAEPTGDTWYSRLPYARYLQVFMVLPTAAVGWVGLALRRRATDRAVLVVAMSIVLLALVGTLLVVESNLGYRTYYFAGTAAVLVTALAFGRLRDGVGSVGRGGTALRVVAAALLAAMVAYLFVFALVGPTSPVGNNVDAVLGGGRGAVTVEEFESRAALIERVPEVSDVFLPEFEEANMDVIVAPRESSQTCEDANRVWDSGVIAACRG